MGSTSGDLPEAATSRPLRPLLKWPGGKSAIVPQILPFLPDRWSTYFEPFLGGGALFFNLLPSRAVIADTNEELINSYIQVRDRPDAVIRALRTHANTEADYYAVRASRPRTPVRRAARFLYLSTLSFNGIHRVNLRGQFNVPYGRKTHLEVCEEDRIAEASRSLQGVRILSNDFEEASRSARRGDLVYFDPPYTVAHANNGFIKYNERIFSWNDQIRLATHARKLADRGCSVLISNADHDSVRSLYAGFRAVRLSRFSRIAASSAHRREISEMLFVGRG